MTIQLIKHVLFSLILFHMRSYAAEFDEFDELFAQISNEVPQFKIAHIVADSLKRKVESFPPDAIDAKKAGKTKRLKSIGSYAPTQELTYLDDIESELINEATQGLDRIKTSKSYTKSFNIHTKKLRDFVLESLENSELRSFVNLFGRIISVIESEERSKGRSLGHIAIRVDPNCAIMRKDSERNFTSQWHAHYDDGRYLFVIATDPLLATEIEHEGVKRHIDTKRIFFMPGPMLHRTPEERPGKRVQISIGLFSES